MSNFNTQPIAKPSYVKTKAFGLCGTLALATALLIGAGSVSADETAAPAVDAQPAVSNVYTADNAGNVTVTPSETVAETPKVLAPAPVESQPIAETPVTTTETAQPVAETPTTPTSVVKEGDTITVTNPNVQVDFPNGNGKYSPFEVEYKDINFPDDMAINEGDKVTFDLPQEVKFQTSYEFDVHNPEKAVVGKATADANTNKVTTVFNDYFKTHPLNKSMSLKLDASWTDKVQSGKPVTANFNGTVVTTNVGAEQVIGKDELIAKWGSQDKDDPTVINWTARVNYAKRVLNYVTIIDEMSENQKLVDNFFEVKNIESVDPWIDKGDAMNLVKSISKSEHGFTITMDRLDHMIYINYKTKLVNAVKDSTNPTNKIELKAESDGAVSYMKIQLVGGRGDASGENKPEPTFEIPHDAPKYEKPEFEGGVVPNDAPILDLPELEIPEEPEKPSTPEKAPKTSVERSNGKVAQSTTVSYKLDSEPKEVANTTVYGGVLPNTGEKEGIMSTLGLLVISAGIAGLTLSFKKYNEGEDK